MDVVSIRVVIKIYESSSLKEKRRVVKSVIQKISHKHNVSISEVAQHDVWNLGVIGIAHVSNDRLYSEKLVDDIIDFLDEDSRFEVLSVDVFEEKYK